MAIHAKARTNRSLHADGCSKDTRYFDEQRSSLSARGIDKERPSGTRLRGSTRLPPDRPDREVDAARIDGIAGTASAYQAEINWIRNLLDEALGVMDEALGVMDEGLEERNPRLFPRL